VQSREDRERAIDQLLKRAAAGFVSAPTGSCTDAETLAAWSERSLPASEAARVEAHLSTCGRCQAMLAAFVHSEPAAPSSQPIWERWGMRWLVPAAAAATAVAVWIAVPDGPPASERTAAVLEDRQAAAPLQEAPATPETASPPAPPPASPEAPRQSGGRAAAVGETAASPRRELDTAAQKAVPPASPIQEETLARGGPAAPLAADAAAGNRAAAESASAPAAATAARAPATAAPSAPAAAAAAPAERREAVGFQAIVGPRLIQSPDPSVRWQLLQDGRVQRSTNSGTTWEPVTVTPAAVLLAGASPEPATAWFVGRGGSIRLSTDGRVARTVGSPATVDLIAVTAVSARTAVVTGSDGRSFRTDDQGATWSSTPTP
jgi:hypothetical protein